MHDFHFIRPWALWAFLPLILLVIKQGWQRATSNSWQQECDPHLLKGLMTNLNRSSQYTMTISVFVVGALMILALAGPAWQKLAQPSFSQKKATVLVLDMSRAMSGKDIKPTRLQRAKFKIEELLKLLPEGQVGLVVFTSEAFLVSPLTSDGHTLKLMLAELTPHMMPVDGSNLKSGFNMATRLLSQAGYQTGNIILITANKATVQDIASAKSLAKEGNHLLVLGMATALGAPVYNDYGSQHIAKLDKASLTALAAAGDGLYQSFDGQDADLKQLVQFIKQERADYKKQETKLVAWQDEGRYLIVFLLPLVFLAFRKGALASL